MRRGAGRALLLGNLLSNKYLLLEKKMEKFSFFPGNNFRPPARFCTSSSKKEERIRSLSFIILCCHFVVKLPHSQSPVNGVIAMGTGFFSCEGFASWSGALVGECLR